MARRHASARALSEPPSIHLPGIRSSIVAFPTTQYSVSIHHELPHHAPLLSTDFLSHGPLSTSLYPSFPLTLPYYSPHTFPQPADLWAPGGGRSDLPAVQRLPLVWAGGGPRTFPGGVSKWQWKRMQEKKERARERVRLAREREEFEERRRAQLRAIRGPERPWEEGGIGRARGVRGGRGRGEEGEVGNGGLGGREGRMNGEGGTGGMVGETYVRSGDRRNASDIRPMSRVRGEGHIPPVFRTRQEGPRRWEASMPWEQQPDASEQRGGEEAREEGRGGDGGDRRGAMPWEDGYVERRRGGRGGDEALSGRDEYSRERLARGGMVRQQQGVSSRENGRGERHGGSMWRGEHIREQRQQQQQQQQPYDHQQQLYEQQGGSALPSWLKDGDDGDERVEARRGREAAVVLPWESAEPAQGRLGDIYGGARQGLEGGVVEPLQRAKGRDRGRGSWERGLGSAGRRGGYGTEAYVDRAGSRNRSRVEHHVPLPVPELPEELVERLYNAKHAEDWWTEDDGPVNS